MAKPSQIMDASPQLSVIVPFYKKFDELRLVLPYNARFLRGPDVELVLVLDEPSQEAEVLALLDTLPLIRARVIVNDHDHDWRPPCKAINVGIRAATGRFILVVSPESLFVANVPGRVTRLLNERPSDIVLGRVAWTTFASARAQAPKPLFAAAVAACGGAGFANDYYGSIAGARELFLAIRGYDESLDEWGGDDDNVRARLSMNGAILMLDPELKLLHLSKGKATRSRTAPHTSTARMRELANPTDAMANPGKWGEGFGRVARDWKQDHIRPVSSSHGTALPIPKGDKLTTGTTARGRRSGRVNVVAVFSFRYDAHLVPDLIANLDPIVDAWVALDDRESDALFSNEVDRRRLLLQAAADTGARWGLGIDPDERLEGGLADKIDDLTRTMMPVAWSFDLRELYASDRYRTDGAWGSKAQARLFPLRGDLSLGSKELHGSWSDFPPRPSGFNLYHLKMIDPVRRRKRTDLYNYLDPEKRYQDIGYDYLADDTGAILECIPPGRSYSPPHRDDGGLWMPTVPPLATQGA